MWLLRFFSNNSCCRWRSPYDYFKVVNFSVESLLLSIGHGFTLKTQQNLHVFGKYSKPVYVYVISLFSRTCFKCSTIVWDLLLPLPSDTLLESYYWIKSFFAGILWRYRREPLQTLHITHIILSAFLAPKINNRSNVIWIHVAEYRNQFIVYYSRRNEDNGKHVQRATVRILKKDEIDGRMRLVLNEKKISVGKNFVSNIQRSTSFSFVLHLPNCAYIKRNHSKELF